MSKARIQEDLKTAMKAGDAQTRDALRLLLAAVTNEEKAKGTTLDDVAVGQVVLKVAKQAKNSIEEYRSLGYPDRVEALQAELAVYERYAPELMGEAQVQAIVDEAIAAAGATGPADMGKVMKLVMPKVAGKADGGMVNRLVKEGLANR
ncbi:MAG: glutamyl-tRNA amidotransferase [Cyanobacteria bacterium RYN_339]|nr:glutamyl-tRNA amidotransferase [Cyanobacteria bacterium RYN_339]